jgi:GNAT superfamily N-acetyltransferase
VPRAWATTESIERPVIEPLGPDHDRAAFSCGVDALDRYLREQAGQDLRRHVAAPFVLRLPRAPRVLGYYTLSAYSIRPSDLAPELARRLPRYPLLPAFLLGRLALDVCCRGRGWGELLLLDALRRCLRTQHEIAAVAVVVDAIDETARAFYERYGFRRFSDAPDRLYLAMSTIQKLFASTAGPS